MNFRIIKDEYIGQLPEKIKSYFPTFDSVFDTDDGSYLITGELASFIVSNSHSVDIKKSTADFINEAIESGGSETEDVIVLQLFKRVYEEPLLSKELQCSLSEKALKIFETNWPPNL